MAGIIEDAPIQPKENLPGNPMLRRLERGATPVLLRKKSVGAWFVEKEKTKKEKKIARPDVRRAAAAAATWGWI